MKDIKRDEEQETPVPAWMSPKQAAEYLGLTVQHLAGLRYEHRGPKYFNPSGRIIKYRREDLDKWMDAGAVTPERA